MSLKVAKFGGTSVADAGQLRQVQSIVEADEGRRWVVPSAPGKRHKADQKVTDLLYLCHESAKRGVGFAESFALISQRYHDIVDGLGLSLELDALLTEIRDEIERGAVADYCASRGEFLNGHIVAAMLGWEFVDPAEIIKFGARGEWLADETHSAVSDRLSGDGHYVVSGFYGSQPDGSIKTFSRGGSDITGAIVARGVGADVYENWTDVSGLLMADPRIVDNPMKIEVLTYRELRELAYMGATVLHDEAIFPVRESGIPVNIRNTNEPEDPGTMIVRSDDDLPINGEITGIAGRTGFSIIAVEKTLMNTEVGFGRRILSVLERNGISFEHMPSGIDTLSLIVSTAQLEQKEEDVLQEIRVVCKPDTLEVEHGVALIATVGRGMMHTPGMAAKVMRALANASVNIRMIDQGSGELNIIVGVRENQFSDAQNAIYSAFCS